MRGAVLVAVLALLAVAGCGDDGGAGGSFGTPTDCATVGKPDQATDPDGDVTNGGSEATDLVAVRVAEGPRRTCAEFTVAGKISGPNAFSLEVQQGLTQAQLDVLVLGGQAPQVLLRTDDDPVGTVVEDAVVGGEGERLSVVVPNTVLRDAGVGAGFAWRARSLSGTGGEGEAREPADCVPDCG